MPNSKPTILLFAFLLFISSCNQDKTPPNEAELEPAIAIDTTLENGLVIKDIQLGTGTPVDSGDYFQAHYIGYLESGEIFDSSYERNTPINFQLGKGQIIQAWELGIEGMRAGGKRMITTPSELAYGETGIPGIIPAESTLRFEIEMLNVIKPPAMWELPSSNRRSTESEIEYIIVSNGSGNKPNSNDQVVVNYSGYLEDNTLFDSSYLRQMPFEFRLGTGYVIRGWEEMISDMRPGEKRTVFIPSTQAYGESGIPGTIPPNETLRFDIELIEVKITNS
ncbi:MAG TPA: peptidylprolyl isomerase [Bacteroidetes bacterium]|nr:peptidylprolyl isomerase [Bacteroidota bacterium]